MGYTDEIGDARSTIESIVELVREDVANAAHSVEEYDEEIEGQMKDYNGARDIDVRYEYERDLEDLVGRRQRFHEEIFEYIDKGRDALHDIATFVEDALDALNGLEESDDIPEHIDWDVPEA